MPGVWEHCKSPIGSEWNKLPSRILGLPAGTLGVPAGTLGVTAGTLGVPGRRFWVFLTHNIKDWKFPKSKHSRTLPDYVVLNQTNLIIQLQVLQLVRLSTTLSIYVNTYMYSLPQIDGIIKAMRNHDKFPISSSRKLRFQSGTTESCCL